MDSSENHWQFNQSKLAERGKYILKNRLWTDCNFIVGTLIVKEFPAHSLILSMASPIFERMFRGELMERDINSIEIPDVQPEAFCAMLNYIYSDKVEFKSFEHACDVYYAANKYMLHNLLDLCMAFIVDNINITNACKGYEFADLFGISSLKKECEDVIYIETASVIDQKSFLDVQMSTVIMILNSDDLNATEVQLFNAVEHWTEAEFSRREIQGENYMNEQQKIYGELLPMFRFLNMTLKDFAEGPSTSPMLQQHESFSILLSLTSTNCSKHFPTGFSTKLRRVGKQIETNICQLDMEDSYVYLEWPLINHIRKCVYLNNAGFDFSCDTNIHVAGIMLPIPNLYDENESDSSDRESTDEETDDIQAWLCDSNEIALVSSHHTVFDQRLKRLKVFFDEPVKISNRRNYRIIVKMRQYTCHSVLKVPHHITHDSVKFNFYCIQTLISGIIYFL